MIRISRTFVISALGLLVLLGTSIVAASDQTPPSAGTAQQQQQPAGTTGQGTPPAGGTSGTAPSAAPTPKLTSVEPEVPLMRPNQALVLLGSDFPKPAQVTLTDPSNSGRKVPDTAITWVDSGRMIVLTDLGFGGYWKVQVADKDGKSPSNNFQFCVYDPRDYQFEFRSPQFLSFLFVALIVTMLLMILIWQLIKALNNSDWSISDALSEESAYQPPVIKTRADIIMLASTSRFIAFVGLLAILTTVLGIGYAILWSLFMKGVVPELEQVKAFLYASACLFAPYLANKLSDAFGGNGPSKPPATAGSANAAPTSAAAITSMLPASPVAAPLGQSIQLLGSGFQQGLTLNFIDPSLQAHSASGTAITSVGTASIGVNVPLPIPGAWQVRVNNPDGTGSPYFDFTVQGAPTLATTDPSPVTRDQNGSATFKINGSGFMSGLTVDLTSQVSAGGAPAPAGAQAPAPAVGASAPAPQTVRAQVSSVTATSIAVAATIGTGQWNAVVTNPGGNASAPFAFSVT